MDFFSKPVLSAELHHETGACRVESAAAGFLHCAQLRLAFPGMAAAAADTQLHFSVSDNT